MMIVPFVLLIVACLHGAQAQDDPDCWVFRARGRGIKGMNDKVIPNTASEDDCVQACVSETEFDCASMEYKLKFKKCFLSQATRDTAGAAYGPIRGMTYRERVLPCGTPGPCASEPCLNGGSCSEGGPDYTCECGEGFGGLSCEEELITSPGPCASEPCLNGGSCSEGGPDYTCECGEGFGGLSCEEEFIDTAFGEEVVARTIEDASQTDTLIPQVIPIPFSGKVIGASFYASRPGEMDLQVYRPAGVNQFTLIGEFRLRTEETGIQTVTFPEDEQIDVQEGDVIGLRFDGPTPIPFDFSDSTGGALIQNAGERTVGSLATFQWIDGRSYAVQALIRHPKPA